MKRRILGFDIGGTKCAVTLAELEGEALHILGKRQFPTDHSISAYEMLDRMYAQAVELGAKGEPIGISCGGHWTRSAVSSSLRPICRGGMK